MAKINLYTFNKETLEFERVPLRLILILPFILFAAVLLHWAYYNYDFIDSWEWQYTNAGLKKIETTLTIHEYLSNGK
jgi:hypothetical protein